MWDPRTYRDEDFGLDEDGRFEPEDDESAPAFDLSQPHIMTVLGPIEPDELGICAPLTHLLATASVNARDLSNLTVASQELEAWVLTNGRSLVEATTKAEGRDLQGLHALAQRNPVHLIASTGSGPNHRPQPRLLEETTTDLTIGVGRNNIRAGVIQHVAEGDRIYKPEADVFAILTEVSKVTGVSLIVDLGGQLTGYSHQDLFLKVSGTPENLILANSIQESSLDASRFILNRGSWLLFSRIGLEDSEGDQTIAQAMIELAEAGFANRLLVSTNLTGGSQFVASNGPGLIHLLERFPLMLMEAGASADLVRQLLIENPAQALTIRRPQPLSPA